MCPTSSMSRAPEPAVTMDLRAAFDVMDRDQDGKISPGDLRAFYAGLIGSDAAEEEIEAMMAAADANRDGFVEYEEFEGVLGRRGVSSGQRKSVVEEMFQVMDRDGDGRVGFDDLKAYLALAGLETSDDDIRAMLMMGGGGGDDDHRRGVPCESLLKILSVDLP